MDFRTFVPERRFQPTLAFTPDGTHLFYSANTSGQYNLWVSDLAGAARQVTCLVDETVRRVAVSPDGTRAVVAVDHHGNEQYQVHLVPLAGITCAGAAVDAGAADAASSGGGDAGHVLHSVTNAPERQFDLASEPFTADGGTLLFAGNDRDERCKDLLLHDLASGRQRRVETPPGIWGAHSVSPDGRRLLAVELHSNSDSDLHLLDLEDPEAALRPVTAHEGQSTHWAGPWARDSSGFWVLSTRGGEHQSLWWYSVADGALTLVEDPGWDVTHVTASRDRSLLVWVVNVAGVSHLRARRDGVDVELPVLPEGTVSSVAVSPDGTRIALLAQTALRPTDVVILDLGAGSVTYLTDSRPPAVRAGGGVAPRLVAYPTHDGREIPAWLYLPEGDGPFPMVLSVHGGPEAQERPEYAYAGLYQYLLAHGVGVLAPNVRGSTGYGKGYQRLILRDWGGAELGDLEHAALYLRGSGFADPARLAVFGGSFGGFAALSCLSRLPEYWAAGVSVVGPSNLVTLARSVPPTWRPLMKAWVGDPETEEEFLLERSPISHVDRIVAPLMVVQGANDPRVVQAESDQIVGALRERGVEVRYDVYPDEGHGFTNRENEIRALADVADFLVSRIA